MCNIIYGQFTKQKKAKKNLKKVLKPFAIRSILCYNISGFWKNGKIEQIVSKIRFFITYFFHN